ncbi:MAG: tRNA pseudouridine(38-40) synthase TruA [Thermoanaerobaculia bacterium]|nr:tRNA pseudouridine(38-40) synthase TruA [Thermoanaerobaculia bacterium]
MSDRALLTVAYVGTAYAGWQRQTNAVAVQQRLDEALADLCGGAVRSVGAGRTDAGVHAEGQAVSVELPRPLDPSALVHGTNARLPADVRVLAARPVPPGFDARRDAVAKLYRYRLSRATPIPPAVRPFVAPAPRELDAAALAAAARALVGRHDFAAFALAGGAAATTTRRLFAAAWDEAGDELVFRVAGEGFLRGMVRRLVGTMLDVAAGRRTLADFAALLAGATRDEAGPTAPAAGLCLERVDYPWDDVAR